MINVEFIFGDSQDTVMVYDVHPRSQEDGPLTVPVGATGFVIWLGTK